MNFDTYFLKEYGKWKIGRVEVKNFISQLLFELYIYATNVARKKNQTVGDKNDLYITLEQLETLLKIYTEPENQEIVMLKKNKFKKPKNYNINDSLRR